MSVSKEEKNMVKEDWKKLFRMIDKIPLVLPEGLKVDGRDVGGWEFTMVTYNLEGKEPYLKAYYETPFGGDYIFNSAYSEELIDYLKEFNLLKET